MGFFLIFKILHQVIITVITPITHRILFKRILSDFLQKNSSIPMFIFLSKADTNILKNFDPSSFGRLKGLLIKRHQNRKKHQNSSDLLRIIV